MGMEAGVTIKQLLTVLNIPETINALVVRNGRILKGDEEILEGDDLRLIQAIVGG